LAWYNGDLVSFSQFDPLEVSANLPTGAAITPGDNNVPNNVGIDEAQANSLDFYPNPCAGTLYFSDFTKDFQVSLFSLTGKLLFNQKLSSPFIDLPQEVSNGFYLVRILAGNKTYKGKVSLLR
jgi:hypothetical protein